MVLSMTRMSLIFVLIAPGRCVRFNCQWVKNFSLLLMIRKPKNKCSSDRTAGVWTFFGICTKCMCRRSSGGVGARSVPMALTPIVWLPSHGLFTVFLMGPCCSFRVKIFSSFRKKTFHISVKSAGTSRTVHWVSRPFKVQHGPLSSENKHHEHHRIGFSTKKGYYK